MGHQFQGQIIILYIENHDLYNFKQWIEVDNTVRPKTVQYVEGCNKNTMKEDTKQ